VGSLALVVVCVAVFVSVYLKAGNEVSVLAVARPVAQGGLLKASDLTVVRISSASRIATVPASNAADVVGRRAAQPLEPDTLLVGSELVTRYSPPAGESIVGLSAKEGQLPASGVAPGEIVDVVLTGLPGAQESSSVGASSADNQDSADGGTSGTESEIPGTVIVTGAKVLEVASPSASSGSDGTVVSLLTSTANAPLIASASAAGQAALIVVTATP
jgi:hypothetical protein